MTDPRPPTHDNDPRAVRLMAAIRDARMERMSQAELAEALGVRQTYVSRWETSRPPRPSDVDRIERALGLPNGTLMRRAGYIEDGTSVEAAILGDDRLTPDYQQLVLNAYRMAVVSSAEARKVRTRSAQLTRRQTAAAKGGSDRSKSGAAASSSKPPTRAPRPKRTTRTS